MALQLLRYAISSCLPLSRECRNSRQANPSGNIDGGKKPPHQADSRPRRTCRIAQQPIYYVAAQTAPPQAPSLPRGPFIHHAGSDPGIGHGGHRGRKRVPGCGRMRIPSWQEPEAFLCMQQSRGMYTTAFPAPEKAGKPFPYPAYTSGPHSSSYSQRVIRNRLSSEPSVPQKISREQAFPSDPAIGTGHVDVPAASARSHI